MDLQALPGSANAGSANAGTGQAGGRLVHGPARAGPDFGIRTVLGDDGRTHVEDTGASPWRMVCHLHIEGPFGSATGTGWFAGPRTVVTAGHCVFDAAGLGGWATRIRVSPGMSDGTAAFGSYDATRFETTDAWRLQGDRGSDIGAILLDAVPGRPDPGGAAGWFGVAALPDALLRDAMVNVSGYPADKPDPPDGRPRGSQQWHARNRITSLTPGRLFYEVDTAVGQSGGPAYVVDRPGGTPVVVGVHAHGIEGMTGGGMANGSGSPANSAPRVTAQVVRLIQDWVGRA